MRKISTLIMSSMFMGFFMLSFVTSKAQVLEAPDASQESKSYQKIGLTDLAVWYHSPQVNERDLWGSLVPYDQIWRAGANENTVFYCSSDIMVEGKKLPAGKYGLHAIPGEDTWTIIFSSNHNSWGSYSYNKEEDVLRVDVTPKAIAHTEWLNYSFTDRSSSHTTLELQWGELAVPLSIDVDVVELTYAHMKDEIRGIYGFSWQGHNQIANYCLQNDVHLNDGLYHANASLGYGRNFNNLMTNAGLERKLGNDEKAKELEKEAMGMANEQQLNLYGYQLMGRGDVDGAMEVFKKNAKDHPDSWNCWDSLAECYLNMGDEKNALKYYRKAKSMAPEGQQSRIDGIISNI